MIDMRARDIEFLIAKRFPRWSVVESLLSSHGSVQDIGGADRWEKLKHEVEEYRAALEKVAPEELRGLVADEQAKEQEAERLLVERFEADLFFSQPHAHADFDHWSRAVYWTVEEGIALALGKAPEVVDWERVRPYVGFSPFALQYSRVRDLAMRAKDWQQLADPVKPGIFLAWARRSGISVAEELVKAVEVRGIVVADWKDMYDKLKVEFDAVMEDRERIVLACERLTEERDEVKAQVGRLEEQISAWEFDVSAENYPAELDVAMQAWRAVSMDRDTTITVKQQILTWLAKSYPKLSDEAQQRIATVCNWGKRGGRPPQS